MLSQPRRFLDLLPSITFHIIMFYDGNGPDQFHLPEKKGNTIHTSQQARDYERIFFLKIVHQLGFLFF